MKRLILFIAICISISSVGQELSCNFTVSSSRLQGTNKQVFTTLQESLNDFMNNTIWTNYAYGTEERIECNILLEVTEQLSNEEFKGTLKIQSRRPVYGSSYNSPILNYIDNDVQFTYKEFDAVNYSENSFITNLSSLLSYYAIIIIGLDSETFTSDGGEEFFRIAERIVSTAQSSGYIGWNGRDDQKRKNRYWLVDNLLESEYEPLRDFLYSYHRHGLDLMEKSPEGGRAGIVDAIMKLDEFNKNKPDPFTYLFTVIMDSKSDEIINIFSEASPVEKQRIKKILVSIDPGGGRKYDKLDE